MHKDLNYTLTEIEGMLPYEKEIYLALEMNRAQEEQKSSGQPSAPEIPTKADYDNAYGTKWG